MNKLLLLFISTTLLFSCSKTEKADAQRDAFAAIQGKYLVSESLVTTINGTSITQVIGKGKGRDLSFGLYGNLDVYTNPITVKKYQFESPDKIYYWTTEYNSNQFYRIQSLAGNKVVLVNTEPSTGRIFTEYFTAE